MHKKQKNEKKKILGPIAVKILFFMVGLFISVAVAGVYAAWSNHVFPGDTITANGWNEVVDKLVEIDEKVSAGWGGLGTWTYYTVSNNEKKEVKDVKICFLTTVLSHDDEYNNRQQGCKISESPTSTFTLIAQTQGNSGIYESVCVMLCLK